MKKVILLIMLVSFGLSETDKEKNFRILSNSKNIYRMNFKTAKCDLSNIPDDILDGFKTSRLFILRKNRFFDSGAILLNKSLSEDNGRFVFFWGVGAAYSVYMPNNKEFCEYILNSSTGEEIKKLIAEAVSVPIHFSPDFKRSY